MSDHISQPYEEGNATSMRSYHSVWMAHWAPTDCKSANQVCNHLSISCESGEESSQAKKRPLTYSPMLVPATDFSGRNNGSGVAAIIGADNPNNESLTVRSKKRRQERLDSESFPVLHACQHREGKMALDVEQAMVSRSGALKVLTGSSTGYGTMSLDRKESQSPSFALVTERGEPKKEHFKSNGIKGYPHQHDDNPNNFLDNNAITVSTFVRDEIMGPTSKFIPYDMSRIGIPFTSYEHNIDNQSNSYMPSKTQVGNTNFHCYSTLFVQETKINQLLDSTRSAKSFSRQNMGTFLLHNPSSSNPERPNFFPIHCDTKKHSFHTFPFQTQSNHPDSTRPEQLDHGGYPLSKVPYSVQNVETMRICTSMDSVGETVRGPPKFSQTTHHFTVSKKTDVSLYQGPEFREPMKSTNLEEKASSAFLSLSTNCGVHDQKKNEVVQPSGTMNGKIENFGNILSSTAFLNNESSSETDFMDMDTFQENRLTGADTSLADKDVGCLKSPLLSASMTDAVRKEIVDGKPMKRLPDINESPPDRSASASLMDNRESSTSKTQSLDVEHLLSNAQQPTNAPTPLDDSAKPEIGSRWVKRLKPSDSDSVHDIKSSKQEEASSFDKANQLLNKMKCNSSSSERSTGQLHRKGKLTIGRTDAKAKDNDSFSNIRKNREILISNPWIRRWCHNGQVPSEKLETVVVPKPAQCSKLTFDKQFPSIAAMALMGKSVTGFQPCEFSKRGSSLVWNTEGI